MATSTHADYPRQREISRMSAEEILPAVLDLIQPKSVIDIGCGIGAWLSVFMDKGVDDAIGVDGDWVPREYLCVPEKNFLPRELTKPLNLGRDFDLVVSLEVAEHIPEQASDTFIGTLVEHGQVILFSAAIPGQGGPGHVNEQWPDYWATKFAKHGYEVIDCIRSKVWSNEKVCWWFAQNTMLYVKREMIESNDKLQELRRLTNDAQLSIVHPKKYKLGFVRKHHPSRLSRMRNMLLRTR